MGRRWAGANDRATRGRPGKRRQHHLIPFALPPSAVPCPLNNPRRAGGVPAPASRPATARCVIDPLSSAPARSPVAAPAVPALRPLGVPERAVHGKSALRGSQFPRNEPSGARARAGSRRARAPRDDPSASRIGSDRASGRRCVVQASSSSSKDVAVIATVPAGGLVNSRAPLSRGDRIGPPAILIGRPGRLAGALVDVFSGRKSD